MATRTTGGERTNKSTRREIVQRTATGVGLSLLGFLGGRAWSAENKPSLGTESPSARLSESPFDVAGREKEIIETAYRLGHRYEKEYGGCCQCALAALQDAVPFLPVDEGLFRAASPLDGGATPGQLQNCGAFNGAAMAIGYLSGRRRDVTFEGTTKHSHELVRKLYNQFEKNYGNIICKDVHEKANGDCAEVVGLAAKWTARILLEEYGKAPDAS